MALASLDGKLAEYTRIPGINTIQLDVKDENGEVAFHRLAPPLAKRVGSAMRYYDPVKAAKQVHSEGLFLIGRVVCFEDPILAKAGPRDSHVRRRRLAEPRRPGLDEPVREAGLGLQPSDRAGRRQGRLRRDPVRLRRFPSDGDIESAVFPGKRNEAMGVTIARFVHYATKRLKPMGVRVSVDVFGLSATRDLGIGQSPRRLSKIVDAIYPMVYPSHYGPGEYGLDSPVSVPGGRSAVAPRLPPPDEARQRAARPLAGGLQLQRNDDADTRSGTDPRRPALEVRRVPALEPIRRLHGRSADLAVSHEATLNELKERVGTILDLKRVSALAGWDQQTMMPPAGNDARADQLATIDRFSHELFVSDETGKLLDELAEHESELDPESIDAALIRVTRRDWEKARRVPPELQAELTKAEVLGVMAWAEARRNSDFEAFLPYLEKNVELKHRYLECFKDTGKSDYDILLDDYQEGPAARRSRRSSSGSRRS